MMDEKNRALMEAHQIAAEDEYFAARPQIDCNDRRKVFEAGFKMAWNIAKREALIEAAIFLDDKEFDFPEDILRYMAEELK